eukprot:scaffold104155_cov118-Phaeocystis_antarctica.AAC.2
MLAMRKKSRRVRLSPTSRIDAFRASSFGASSCAWAKEAIAQSLKTFHDALGTTRKAVPLSGSVKSSVVPVHRP